MKSNINTLNRLRLAVATAVFVTCVGGASSALARDEIRTETVKFQDLNVDSSAGVQALYGRIHAAAKRVCAENDLSRLGAQNACAKKAEADAIEKLNLSQLTAYYKTKTKSKTGDNMQPLVAAR
jgi:UrcA family protein